MGKSKKQTVGYRYRAGLMVAIGNCIERVLDINPGETGWQFSSKLEQDILKNGDTSIVCYKPELFGGDNKEGGWVGTIDIHTGKPQTARRNNYLQEHLGENVSAYPRLSYLVFKGGVPVMGKDQFGRPYVKYTPGAFQLVSMSGMMKDFLLWVKRTRIKGDGSQQWFPSHNAGGGLTKIVCEIGGYIQQLPPIIDTPGKTITYLVHRSGSYQSEQTGATPSLNADNEFYNKLYPKTLKTKPESESNDRYFYTFDGAHGGWSGTAQGDSSFSANLKIKVEEKCILWLYFEAFEMNPTNIVMETDGQVIEQLTYKVASDVVISSSTSTSFAKTTDKYRYFYKIALYKNGEVSISVSQKAFKTARPSSPYNEHSFDFGLFGINLAFTPHEERQPDVKYTGLDINPIHKIREILTDYEAMSKPESDINDDNFREAAIRIYEEGLGISWAVTEKSCKEALDELLYHIEAGLRVNRQTGKYEVVLFRDELTTPVANFTTSNMKSFSVDIANADDLTNTVNVHFYDRENIKNASFALSDVGGVLTAGRENTETVDFPYFMQKYNAEKVGNWKLKQLATPLWRGSFKTGDYDARKLNRYDVITISYPDLNIVNLSVRIMKISLGDGIDNTVTIDFVEIIEFSSLNYGEIGTDDFEHTPTSPQYAVQDLFEAPYFELVQKFGERVVEEALLQNSDMGYVMAVAVKPQSNSINAELWTDLGTMEYTNLEQVATVDYTAGAYIAEPINEMQTSILLEQVKNVDTVSIGTYMMLNDEILVYESYDKDTKIITVKRGALDTIPKKHTSGYIFFADEFNALDPNEYNLGDRVSGQVLTRTPSGLSQRSPGWQIEVPINARANRPYPPANVKTNGEYFPESIDTDLHITWAHRNRLQQTGGEIIGWYEPSVTLESGATYHIKITDTDTDDIIVDENIGAVDEYTLPISALENISKINIELYSVRDSYDSYQKFEHGLLILSD